MAHIDPTVEQIVSVHNSLLERLRSRGDPATAEAQFRYMKGVVRFHGIKAPALKTLVKELAPAWKGWSVEGRTALAWQLLLSEFFEEKDTGVAILKPVAKSLDDLWLKTAEARFEKVVTGWATCDTLCGSVFRAMLPNAGLRGRIVGWKDSSDPWLQRAAAVSFVNEARHGLYNDEILSVCRATVKNPHRFVQLGTGWVLRELSLADRGLVNAFIREHRPSFSAEGLRYALEKHPANERAALTAL